MKWKRLSIPDVYIGFLLLPVIGIIALISSFVLTMIPSKGPAFIRTEGQDAASIVKTFGADFTSVMRDGGKVHIHSTHFLDGGNGLVRDLTLVPPQVFYIPDKHSSLQFVLKSMPKDGIELSYDNRFDLRDFGKNEITEDTGTVEIPWKN